MPFIQRIIHFIDKVPTPDKFYFTVASAKVTHTFSTTRPIGARRTKHTV